MLIESKCGCSWLALKKRCRLLGLTLTLGGAGLLVNVVQSDHAIAANQIIENPPNATILRFDRGVKLDIRALESAGRGFRGRSPTGEVVWDTDIEYVDTTIFNPRTGQHDKVHLRAYDQNNIEPNSPLVAPTINMWPGETFRVNLNNKLPADDPTCQHVADPNVPHCFNSTNLHTHGLWINPAGNSDNVLIKINPGVEFQYEYNVPPDHPAGTFWYHPHLHGSTALQVGSGMAGALIIRGDRPPLSGGTNIRPGDIDTLLLNPSGTPFNERIMLFQQVPYACWENGKIKTGPKGNWICDPQDVGVIEQYEGQFGPSDWNNSGRYTSINGVVAGQLKDTEVGRIARWRLVHAGVRDTIYLTVLKMPETSAGLASAKALAEGSDQDREDFISNHCRGEEVQQFSIATDGLTRRFVVPQQSSTLQPGYREDLLMVFSEPGTYCVIDKESEAGANVNNQASFNQILGFIEVAPSSNGTVVGDPQEFIQKSLLRAAGQFMPNSVKAAVVADLEDGLQLTAFSPHEPISQEEVTGQQTLSFNIDINATPTAFQVGNLDAAGNPVDLKSYQPDVVDRHLTLGGVDEWIMKSNFVSHPFHIHVNPFEIIEVIDNATGKDVSGYEPGNTSPYARTKGAWKDTLMIHGAGSGQPIPYTVKVRTRYQRYIGEFVLHCHILDHEDQGMMQNVMISLPDGNGGVTGLEHH